MVRTVDYDSRRKAVLSATINRYIKNAQPVASDDIAKEFGLSPATIRNIFAELEDSGYLTHPYTSAGRVPTDKGYRYYVDFLLSQIELLDSEKDRIVHGYRKKIVKLEDALEITSDIVSDITHYTSVVSFLDWQERFFYNGVSFILDHPEFQDLGRIRSLMQLIEDKKRMLELVNRDFEGKVKIYIGQELGSAEMEHCALAVSSYKVRNRPQGRVAVLGPARMEYDHIISILEYVTGQLTEELDRF